MLDSVTLYIKNTGGHKLLCIKTILEYMRKYEWGLLKTKTFVDQIPGEISLPLKEAKDLKIQLKKIEVESEIISY